MKFDPKTDPIAIVGTPADVNRLIDVAQDTGQTLAKNRLTSSQIRNIFGEVRAIEANWKSDPEGSFRRVALLEPKLAYAAARGGARENPVEELSKVLTPCIGVIRNAAAENRKKYFDRFVDFFEAILAYHRDAGGRTS